MDMAMKSITDLAAQIEQKGVRFYKNMAAAADDDKIKKVFLFLADQEQEHADAFTRIGQEMSSKDEIYGFAGRLKVNIENLANMFRKEAMDNIGLADAKMTMGEAVDIAIELEERAIKLYGRIIELMPEDLKGNIEVVSRLREEEIGHRDMLTRVKNSAKL